MNKLTKEQEYVNKVLGNCYWCKNPIYEDGMTFTNLDIENSLTKPYHQKCFEKEREVIKMLTDTIIETEKWQKEK